MAHPVTVTLAFKSHVVCLKLRKLASRKSYVITLKRARPSPCGRNRFCGFFITTMEIKCYFYL